MSMVTMQQGANGSHPEGVGAGEALKRVRSEGCVLKRQPLVRNSPLPLASCYRLEEVIGRGSFGCVVFRATDVLSGVRRVVKCVRREEPEGLRLWRNEVRILRTLDHPNVLRLFEVFEESSSVYQVTETCHGGDLHQWLDRRLRRRQRHARKGCKGSLFVQHPSGPDQQQQQQQHQQQQQQQALTNQGAVCMRGEAIEPSTDGRSSSSEAQQAGDAASAGTAAAAATAAPTTAATTPTSAESERVAQTSPTGGVGSRRCSSTVRASCPAAVGAAAAEATAAATAATASLPPSSIADVAALSSSSLSSSARPLVREELASRLVAQVLCALRYIHSKGIAHCDVKLENFLLVNEFEDSEAGDGQSSDEEEERLEQEEQQQQRQLQQQQQLLQLAHDAVVLSHATRGLRSRSSAQLAAAAGANASTAFTALPTVLRRRRVSKETHQPGGVVGESCRNTSSHSLLDGISRRDVTVKLADFGLARRIVRGKPPKVVGRVCEGTLYYRSPWIVRGLTEGDARSDLWALGVALYILFFGKPPFDGDNEDAVAKAIAETPVSFSGGVWSSLSLQCVGFLRALLYNPLLPLHLRGPPPPPPYVQPTADLMLKHPWIQQCVREERRRGLMRAISAPSFERTAQAFGVSAGAEGSCDSPRPLIRQHAADSPSLQFNMLSLRCPFPLVHPQRTPSEPPSIQQTRSEQALESRDSCPDFCIVSDPPILQRPSAHNKSSTSQTDLCCSTCSLWNCPFGCCSSSCSLKLFETAAPALRICWGRAPLVHGSGLIHQHQQKQQQQQQKQPQVASQQTDVQLQQADLQHQKRPRPPTPDEATTKHGSSSPEKQGQVRSEGEPSRHICALEAAGITSLTCITCGEGDPRLFSYEETAPFGGISDDLHSAESEPLHPHLRLARSSSGLYGLERCAAATNAAAAAAAAAAGVARAVRRDASSRVYAQRELPLENVPHMHLRMRCAVAADASFAGCLSSALRRHADRMDAVADKLPVAESCSCVSPDRRCCIAVVDWLTAELFEARVPLLLQACAWLDFARLSPLQKALRSVVVKLMEEDPAVRLVRDVLWVLDPQQSGSVSRQCLLDSLKVVRDFFILEFALRHGEAEGACVGESEAFPPTLNSLDSTNTFETADVASPRTPEDCGSPFCPASGWTDRAPASPLQAILMFATVSPGDLPPLSVLEPYCKVLQRALEIHLPPCSPDANPQPAGNTMPPSKGFAATGGPLRCQLDEALVCMDTDGSGGVEFDEFLAASMTRADFRDREPACSVAFRALDRNLDGFVSANDLLTILHFDSRSDLQGVLQSQKQRADAAVAAYKAAAAAAEAAGEPAPPGALLDDTVQVCGFDEHGEQMSVPAGASYILQLEGVTAATAPLYVQVARELKAIQPRPSGLWTFEEFMKLL